MIYREFFKTSLSQAMSFRFDFLLQSLMNMSFMIIYYSSAFFIFNYVEKIGLWDKDQFFVFLSFVFVINQTHQFFFSFNFWQFSEDIRLGNLDFHLLKPFPLLFTVLLRTTAVGSFFTLLLTYGLFIYFGIKADLSVLSWILMPFSVLIALSLMLGLEVLISLINFFTIEGGAVNQIRIQVQHLQRWPDFIYKRNYLLFIFPFVAVTSVPVRSMLDFSFLSWFFLMSLGAILLWTLIVFFWPRFLVFYKSPSS